MKSILASLLLIAITSISAADREWTSYNPGNGAYTIKFPAHPEYQTQQADYSLVHVYIAKDVSQTPASTYALSFTELPKEKAEIGAEKVLDLERNNFVKAVNGKLLSEKAVTLEKHPGRELLVSAEDGKARYVVREFLAGARVIHLVMWAPAARAETAATDAQKFFESCALSAK